MKTLFLVSFKSWCDARFRFDSSPFLLSFLTYVHIRHTCLTERQQIDTYFLFAIGNRCLISHSIEAFFNDKCSRTSMYSWISNWDQKCHSDAIGLPLSTKKHSLHGQIRLGQSRLVESLKSRSLLLSSSCTNNMQLDLTAIADYKSQLSHHHDDEWTTDG